MAYDCSDIYTSFEFCGIMWLMHISVSNPGVGDILSMSRDSVCIIVSVVRTKWFNITVNCARHLLPIPG